MHARTWPLPLLHWISGTHFRMLHFPAGAVAADQVVNARKYVHHVWTAIVLALVTALFVVASLLPLLDPWATAAGLLTGGAGRWGLGAVQQGSSKYVAGRCSYGAPSML